MENTYLDPEAMLKRINSMKDQADTIHSEIKKTNYIMEELKSNFEGESANRLQKKYTELSDTYDELLAFLNAKAEMMTRLTGNIQSADQE